MKKEECFKLVLTDEVNGLTLTSYCKENDYQEKLFCTFSYLDKISQDIERNIEYKFIPSDKIDKNTIYKFITYSYVLFCKFSNKNTNLKFRKYGNDIALKMKI